MDDEQSIQTLLSYPLRKEGYDVVQATDGRQALDRFEEQPFDLVVLDLMLPKIDGLEVCRRLRSRSSVPIIMLTAKSEEIDKVVGLELGADDYITKPFSVREFSSRIKAALRRAEMTRPAETAPDEAPLVVRELRIDFPKRTVRVRGDEAPLTFVEFEILSALARGPGRVFTRDMLLARIWGDSAYRDPRTIDVHIRHLREKIERDPKDPEYLFTVRGVGYRFRRHGAVGSTMYGTEPGRWRALLSLRNRLAFVFFGITFVAIGRCTCTSRRVCEDALIDERLSELADRRAGPRLDRRSPDMIGGPRRTSGDQARASTSRRPQSGYRVTLLSRVSPDSGGPQLSPQADSSKPARRPSRCRCSTAYRAARTGMTRDGAPSRASAGRSPRRPSPIRLPGPASAT